MVKRWAFFATATILAGLVALAPSAAEAHGRPGFHGGFVGGYWGFGPYWGWYGGYGPYGFYGPWGPYAPNGYGVVMGIAGANGVGAVDLNVKPGEAEVWVDGRYVAEARDLDGSPGFLWLKEGPHRLVIYKGGYRSFDEEISVDPGRKMDLKVRLQKGESTPPGTKPKAKPSSTD